MILTTVPSIKKKYFQWLRSCRISSGSVANFLSLTQYLMFALCSSLRSMVFVHMHIVTKTCVTRVSTLTAQRRVAHDSGKLLLAPAATGTVAELLWSHLLFLLIPGKKIFFELLFIIYIFIFVSQNLFCTASLFSRLIVESTLVNATDLYCSVSSGLEIWDLSGNGLVTSKSMREILFRILKWIRFFFWQNKSSFIAFFF